jgi:hypothetical protein
MTLAAHLLYGVMAASAINQSLLAAKQRKVSLNLE